MKSSETMTYGFGGKYCYHFTTCILSAKSEPKNDG